MHPTFYVLSVEGRLLLPIAYVAAVLLSGYVVFDAVHTHGRAKLKSGLLQAGIFLAVCAWVIGRFVVPETLPAVVEIPLRSWGLMVVLGGFVCFALQRHFGLKVGLTGDQILTIWIFGGISSAIGCRALHVLANLSSYLANPLSILAFWDGGMAYMGGVAAALVFTVWYTRRLGLGLEALDAVAIPVPLTHFIGRIGCFLAGCCYGRETESFVGVSFPPGSIAHATMVAQGRIGVLDSTPLVHATQIYEGVYVGAVGVALLYWYLSRRPKPGLVTAMYFAGYSVGRFFLEIIRDDPEREFVLRIPEEDPRFLSTSQFVSVLFVVVVILAARHISRSGTGAPAAATGPLPRPGPDPREAADPPAAHR